MNKASINKIKNYLLVVLIILTISFGVFSAYTFSDLQEEKNKLTAKDAEIMQLDKILGLSKSRLLKVEDLNNKYKKDIDLFPQKLKDIIDEYGLKMKSKDTAIALLTNKIKGGRTKVVIKEVSTKNNTKSVIIEDESGNKVPIPEQVISYEWEEELGRFKLKDSDIFTSGNEEFESNQHMKVVGHVFFGKDGQLQIRKVELQEVIPNGIDKDGNPKYKLVPNSKIKLIDSQFEYTNNLPVRKKSLFDIITLRPIATFDTALTPGIGMEFLNLGRLIDYANIGFNTKLNVDLSDPLGGSIQNSRMSLGLHYQFIPPFLDTNFAIGASVGVPFSNITQPVFTIDVIMFLTQDLNPLNWDK